MSHDNVFALKNPAVPNEVRDALTEVLREEPGRCWRRRSKRRWPSSWRDMPISALPNRIWNSGHAAFLIEQRQPDGKAVLVFVAAQAIPFMLLDVPPVTAGWNSEGFAVIDGNKVLSSRRGVDKVQVLATDASFRDSQ